MSNEQSTIAFVWFMFISENVNICNTQLNHRPHHFKRPQCHEYLQKQPKSIRIPLHDRCRLSEGLTRRYQPETTFDAANSIYWTDVHNTTRIFHTLPTAAGGIGFYTDSARYSLSLSKYQQFRFSGPKFNYMAPDGALVSLEQFNAYYNGKTF